MSSIRWEDMVFMNRNQSYGAYLLRKAYPGRVNLSFVFAMIVVALILFSPNIKAMILGKEPVLAVNEEKTKVVIDMAIVPPIEMPVIPPPRVEMPKSAAFVPPKVTDQEVVEDVTPTIKDLMETNVSTDTGDGVEFIETTGTGELPAEVVPDESDKVWTYVEIAPEFPGGMAEMIKFIGKNMKYPSIDRRMGNYGKVFVSFVVGADGTITDIKTEKGVSGTLDEEAMRVIGKMPKWKPGRQGGNAVRVRYILPINFTLGGA